MATNIEDDDEIIDLTSQYIQDLENIRVQAEASRKNKGDSVCYINYTFNRKIEVKLS